MEDGRVFEIRNWQHLQTDRILTTTVVGRPLKGTAERKYHVLKGVGLTDSQIFFKLNPSIPNQRQKASVEVPMEILGKEQLVWLIEQKIGERVESLDGVSRRDLVRLLLALSK